MDRNAFPHPIDEFAYPEDSVLWSGGGQQRAPSGPWTRTTTVSCDVCSATTTITTTTRKPDNEDAMRQLVRKLAEAGWSTGDDGERCPDHPAATPPAEGDPPASTTTTA